MQCCTGRPGGRHPPPPSTTAPAQGKFLLCRRTILTPAGSSGDTEGRGGGGLGLPPTHQDGWGLGGRPPLPPFMGYWRFPNSGVDPLPLGGLDHLPPAQKIFLAESAKGLKRPQNCPSHSFLKNRPKHMPKISSSLAQRKGRLTFRPYVRASFGLSAISTA